MHNGFHFTPFLPGASAGRISASTFQVAIAQHPRRLIQSDTTIGHPSASLIVETEWEVKGLGSSSLIDRKQKGEDALDLGHLRLSLN